MTFNPFFYKDGLDFLKITGMTHDEALEFLEKELKNKIREKGKNDNKHRFYNKC